MGHVTAQHEIIRVLRRGLITSRRDGGAEEGGALRDLSVSAPRIADRFARVWRDPVEDHGTGYQDQEAVDGR